MGLITLGPVVTTNQPLEAESDPPPPQPPMLTFDADLAPALAPGAFPAELPCKKGLLALRGSKADPRFIWGEGVMDLAWECKRWTI